MRRKWPRKKRQQAQQRPIPTHRLHVTQTVRATQPNSHLAALLFGASFALASPRSLENDAPMRRFLQTLLREPLLHFALLGGLLCCAYWFVRPVPREQIVIPKELVSARRGDLLRRLGRPPTAAELAAATSEYVESEVLYREAQRRRLGDGDIIIRRRLIQKMEYLADALIPPSIPTDAELVALRDATPARYLLPSRIALRQVFVGFDKHKDRAESVAAALHDRLQTGTDPALLGDPHALGANLPLHSESELAQLFSASWAAAAFALPDGNWSTPLRSPFGLHFIQVTGRQAGAMPSLSALRDRLRLDYAEQNRADRRQRALGALLPRYEVVQKGGT